MIKKHNLMVILLSLATLHSLTNINAMEVSDSDSASVRSVIKLLKSTKWNARSETFLIAQLDSELPDDVINFSSKNWDLVVQGIGLELQKKIINKIRTASAADPNIKALLTGLQNTQALSTATAPEAVLEKNEEKESKSAEPEAVLVKKKVKKQVRFNPEIEYKYFEPEAYEKELEQGEEEKSVTEENDGETAEPEVNDNSRHANADNDNKLKEIPDNCISLGCENITDAGCIEFERFKKLEYLYLNNCSEISDAGFTHVAKNTVLKQLWFEGGSNLTSLAPLAHLTHLKDLRIMNNSDLQDTEFGYLSNLTNLEQLDLRGCGFTNTGFSHLNRLTNLRILFADFKQKPTEDPLPILPNLTYLYLDAIQDAPDMNIEYLPHMPKLTELRLQRLTVTGLKLLNRYPQLEDLTLDSCDNLTDAGLADIADCSTLKIITLHGCKLITYEGVMQLFSIPQLGRISIQACPNITEAQEKEITQKINERDNPENSNDSAAQNSEAKDN